jgi:hypothetical protein
MKLNILNKTFAFYFIGLVLVGNALAEFDLEAAKKRNFNKKLEFTGKTLEHTVQPGDSFMTISHRYYGTHQKWQDIIDANPSIDPAKLAVGEIVLVKEATVTEDAIGLHENEKHEKEIATEVVSKLGKVDETVSVVDESNVMEKANESTETFAYQIKAGDSYASVIEQFYGNRYSWDRIEKINPDVDPSMLKIGQTILVPKLPGLIEQDQTEHSQVVVQEEEKKEKVDIEFAAAQIDVVAGKKPVPKKKPVVVEVKPKPQAKVEVQVSNADQFKVKEQAKVISNLEEQIAKLLEENKKLREDNVDKSESSSELSGDLDEARKQASHWEQKYQKLAEALDDKKVDAKNLAELKQQNDELIQSIKKMEKDEKEQIQRLKLENKELMSSLKAKEERFYLKGEKSQEKMKDLLQTNNDLREKLSDWKDKYATLEERQRKVNDSLYKTQKELDKLQNDHEELVDRKVANLNMQDQMMKIQQEYDELQSEYLDLKETNIQYKKEIASLNMVERKYEKAQDSLKDYEQDVKDLKQKVTQLEKENKKVESEHPLYMRSLLAQSQADMIKEKNRLLTEKLWVEKNKDFGKCVVEISQHDPAELKTIFRDFVLYLNEQFGSENVLISNSEDKLIFKIPGKTVWGVRDPKVSSKYFETLAKIDHYMKQLPVDKVHITGFSKYKSVKGQKSKEMDGDLFILGQSVKLQKYFVNELGWLPNKVSSSSGGYKPDSLGNAKKEFEFHVSLKNNKKERKIASVLKKDRVLNNIQSDILEKLSEPKYSKVDLSKDSLDIHLGRHYFFSTQSESLTRSGKRYIDNLMAMFVLASDANFELLWVPGRQEKNTDDNVSRSLREIASVKKYLNEKHHWVADRIQFGYANRHHSINDGLTYAQDRFNKRLIFKVIPTGVNIKKMDEVDGI